MAVVLQIIGAFTLILLAVFSLIGLLAVVDVDNRAEEQRQAANERVRTAHRQIMAISRRAQNAIIEEAFRRAQDRGQKPS